MEIKTDETKEELPSWLRTLMLRISIPDKKIDIVTSMESNPEQILDCPNSFTFQKTNVGVDITCENCEKERGKTFIEIERGLRSRGTDEQWAKYRRLTDYMNANPGLYSYSSLISLNYPTPGAKNIKTPVTTKDCINTCGLALTVLKMFQDFEELHILKYAKAEFLHPHNTTTGQNIIHRWRL